MQRKVNLLLLMLGLLGAGIGFVLGELLLGVYGDSMPRAVLIGLYFGVVALSIGICTMIAELMQPILSGSSWRARYTDLSWKLLVPATLVLMFLGGSLFQLLYGLHLGGERQVRDYVLVIDNSGSMLQTDPNNDRFTSARELVDRMRDDSRVAVVVFTDQAEVVQPFTRMDRQIEKDEVYAAIDSLQTVDGGTDFAAALDQTLQLIENRSNPDRGVMAILLSDGQSDADIQSQLDRFVEQEIVLHTIGLALDDASGVAALESISSVTGGSYHDVREADELSLIYQTLYDESVEDRTLVTERDGPSADSTFYQWFRILAIVALGGLMGIGMGLFFDNRYLARSFGIGGAVGGLIGGWLLDNSLSGAGFTDGLTRLATLLIIAFFICLFPLLVPVRENNRGQTTGTGKTRRAVRTGRPTDDEDRPVRDRRHRGF
ncbi:vWA domain-containing protein [Paenibacillus daejeonensis]|uniref:vWA domain-containing protein n=1 Tax=Paenibacillus daejeonensis TaxID=135193 RepID=UPI0003683D69|nr:vWA domain-containing protein [Paenibacillus daejeonensis]